MSGNFKSFCLFRESALSPIFESSYDYETGTIEGVPESKFKAKVDARMYSYAPSQFVPHKNADYGMYYYVLMFTGALMVTNYYDIGYMAIGPGDKLDLYLSGINEFQRPDYVIEDSFVVFPYEKFPIGTYKTVMRQYRVENNYSVLYCDKNGEMLTSNGVVKIPIENPKSCALPLEGIVKGSIRAWRNNYDGMVSVGNDTKLPYNIEGTNFIIRKEVL